MRIWWLGSPRERSGGSPMCLRRTRIEPSSCARRLSASLSGAKLAGAKPRAQGIFGNDKISTELALDSDRRAKKINALDQAAPLAGWQLPEGFMTLRRLLEARMGKQGKREFVQVLRLMETFSPVYGPVFIAPSEKRPRLITSAPACSLSTKVQSLQPNSWLYASGARPSSPVMVGWSTRNRPRLPRSINEFPDARSLPLGLAAPHEMDRSAVPASRAW
jgi:hypothetical protein